MILCFVFFGGDSLIVIIWNNHSTLGKFTIIHYKSAQNQE